MRSNTHPNCVVTRFAGFATLLRLRQTTKMPSAPFKNLLHALFFAVVCTAALYISCRKIDHQAKPESAGLIERKFFTIPMNTDADVINIMNSIYHQNEQRHFVSKLARSAGYPQWNKAMIAGKKQSGHRSISAKGLGDDSTSNEMIYIPFIRENGNFTNAVLIVKATSADTAYRVLYRTDYKLFSFDTTNLNGWNARDVFHLFSIFERSVFGHSKLIVRDERLLTNADRTTLQTKRLSFSDIKVVYTFNDSIAGGGHRGTSMAPPDPPLPTCDHYSVCYAPINTANLCDFCSISNCDYYMGTGTECTVFVFLDSNPDPTTGGGGGGGGGTGGDGGSGSGGLEDDCDGSQQSTTLCGSGDPGWEPVVDKPAFNPYIADSVILDTSITNNFPCVKKILDSISQYSNMNAIAQIALNTVFNIDKKIHLTYIADPALTNQSTEDAYTHPDSARMATNGSDSINFYATVHLNYWVLTHSSQEYIAATIIHEAVHAYIDYKYSQYSKGLIDSTEFKTLFPLFWAPNFTNFFTSQPTELAQHTAMAGNLITIMAAPLNVINPNVPANLKDSLFRALAWGGLQETTIWKSRSDTNDLKALNFASRDTSVHAPFIMNGAPSVQYNFDHVSLNLKTTCQ